MKIVSEKFIAFPDNEAFPPLGKHQTRCPSI
jgi:hypothetical protein